MEQLSVRGRIMGQSAICCADLSLPGSAAARLLRLCRKACLAGLDPAGPSVAPLRCSPGLGSSCYGGLRLVISACTLQDLRLQPMP